MKHVIQNDQLKKPLTSLRLSDAFKKMAELHGFSTLDELLCLPLNELVTKEWFSASMYEELAWVMKDHGSHC